MGNNDTYFSQGGGGGAAASDYISDAFVDISTTATANTGFSSTVGKNPFNQAFQNDDAPKFEYKTLWVKDLVLLDDHSLWINSRPTYKVIFKEEFPGVYAYVFGNIRLRNLPNGVSVDLRESGDGFGITTTGRRVHWILNPSEAATQSAFVSVDGAANAVTATYGSNVSANVGYNKNLSIVHATTQDTRDIHDYRLQASNTLSLNVAGIGVYFEAATAGTIDCYPGSTYVDFDKKTTTTGSEVTVPSVSGFIGGNVLVYKTSANAYAAVLTERTNITSIATGTAGTNQITVETGKGASFPIGTGIVVNSHGGSYYVGSVQSVSTDTLTVGPSLLQGLSGLIYRAWAAGPSTAISATLYQKVAEFDPASSNYLVDGNTFENTTSVQYFQDPQNVFRAWGVSVTVGTIDGRKGLGFLVTGSQLNVEGRFVAAEAEWAALPGNTSMIHATYMINGAPGAWSQLQGFTSLLRQTVFTDSVPGWNMFRITAGATMYNAILRKISFYDLAPSHGQTLGRLAHLNIHGSSMVGRYQVGVTACALGAYQRIYADQMYLTGPWSRGVTSTACGGVAYTGGSNTIQATVNFFGQHFAVIGAGSSVTISLNGAGFGSTLNQMLSVATLGFHSVVVSSAAGSLIINAFDYFRPRGELNNLQSFLPRPELDDSPKAYMQSETPQSPKNGDVWAADPQSGSVWIYLWNRWNQIQISTMTDDPQVGTLYWGGGTT